MKRSIDTGMQFTINAEMQSTPELEAAIKETLRRAFERHDQLRTRKAPEFLEGEFTIGAGQISSRPKSAPHFRIVERGGRFFPQHRWLFMWLDMHDARYEIGDGILVIPGAVNYTTAEDAAAFIHEIEVQ